MNNDEAHKLLIEQQKALLRNPALFRTGLVTLFMFGGMAMSAFAAIGLFVIGSHEETFLNNAVQTSAVVTEIDEQTEVTERKIISGSENKTQVEIRHFSTVAIQFQDQQGATVDTRLRDGSSTLLRKGDVVQILFDPDNPQETRFLKNRTNVQFMKSVSYAFLAVFSVLFLLNWWISQKRRSHVVPTQEGIAE